MPTRDQYLYAKVIEDMFTQGVDSEAESKKVGLPGASYAVGFHNGLVLALDQPETARVLKELMGDAIPAGSKAEANIARWLAEWRTIMGTVTLVPSSDVKGGAEGSKGTDGALDETRAEQR